MNRFSTTASFVVEPLSRVSCTVSAGTGGLDLDYAVGFAGVRLRHVQEEELPEVGRDIRRRGCSLKRAESSRNPDTRGREHEQSGRVPSIQVVAAEV